MNGKNIRYGTKRRRAEDKKPWKAGRKLIRQVVSCVIVFLICIPIAKTETGMKNYISGILVTQSDIERAKEYFKKLCVQLADKYPVLNNNELWNVFMLMMETPQPEENTSPEVTEEIPQTPQEALELVAKASPEEFEFPESVNMIMPLAGEVTSPFGGREHPVSGGDGVHHGVDIAGDYGDTIISAAPGKVLSVGENDTYGKYVLIQHTESMKTLYAHCEEICVIEGEIVDGNTLIARVGSTGLSTGPHLHFEIRVNDETVNPEDYIAMQHRQ